MKEIAIRKYIQLIQRRNERDSNKKVYTINLGEK